MLTHFVIPGFLAFLLVGVSACATNKEVAPVKDEETVTRELFYMVSPSFHIGKDWPRNLSPKDPNDFFAYIKPSDGKAFALATFTLEGEDGTFLTTLLAYTKDGDGLKGWNLILNRDGKGNIERKYVSVANGEKAELVLTGALYLVATEVPIAATQEDATAEEVDTLLDPTLKHLRSLL